MLDAHEADIAQTVTAMVTAALRGDREDVAYLAVTTPREQLPAVAAVCALFAARTCWHLDLADPTLDHERALNDLALRLAAAH